MSLEELRIPISIEDEGLNHDLLIPLSTVKDDDFETLDTEVMSAVALDKLLHSILSYFQLPANNLYLAKETRDKKNQIIVQEYQYDGRFANQYTGHKIFIVRIKLAHKQDDDHKQNESLVSFIYGEDVDCLEQKVVGYKDNNEEWKDVRRLDDD